jgi:WD40 repeat protein
MTKANRLIAVLGCGIFVAIGGLPVGGQVPTTKKAAGTKPAALFVDRLGITAIDVGSVKPADFTKADKNWRLPAPATTPAAPTLKTLFPLPNTQFIGPNQPFTFVSKIAFTGLPANQVFISSVMMDAQRGITRKVLESKLSRVDMRTGSVVAETRFPDYYSVMAVSSDASLVVMVGEPFQNYTNPRLDFYRIDPTNAFVPVASWIPYPSPFPNSPGRSPSHVMIAGPDIVITSGGPTGEVTAWKLPECRAIWNFIPRGPSFAVSPDGKLLACMMRDGLYILDTATGQARAKFLDHDRYGLIRWSPDGRRLAVVGQDVIAWDLTTGKTVVDVAIPRQQSTWVNDVQRVAWVGDHYLMRDEAVIDLEQGVCVWWIEPKYDSRKIIGQPDNHYWNWDSSNRVLLGVTVPNAEMIKASTQIKAAGGGVGPGTKVSLKITLAPEYSNREPILRKLLLQHFKDAGWEYSDQEQRANVLVDLSKSTDSAAYSGGDGSTSDATITSYTYKISIQLDKEEVWFERTTAGGSTPQTVLIKEGESLQGNLDRDRDYLMNNLLRTVPQLPNKIAKPVWYDKLGKSSVSPTGTLIPYSPKN